MTGILERQDVEISTSSGMVIARIRPRSDWPFVLLMFAGAALLSAFVYNSWSTASPFVRAIWIFALVSTISAWFYQFSGEEIIEIDPQKLAIRKGIHGWERKREYPISKCSNLGWCPGHKGNSYLGCKAGRWPIQFAKQISEDNANKILTALQQTLPDVAQKICSSQGYREHFITLGLNKP